MRLFIGIKVPASVHQSLWGKLEVSFQEGSEHPEDYHITMLFVGDVSLEEFENVKSLLKKIIFPKFTLELAGWGFFHHKIFFQGIKPNLDLSHLKQQLDGLFPQWIDPRLSYSYFPVQSIWLKPGE